MNSRERKSGNGIMNIKKHSTSSRRKLQFNVYLYFQREIVNSEWKKMLQNTQQKKFYPKNKKANRNPLYFYQE